MLLTHGHFGKQVKNAWKVLKRGAGEKWNSWTDRVRMKKYRIVSRSTEISYIQ